MALTMENLIKFSLLVFRIMQRLPMAQSRAVLHLVVSLHIQMPELIPYTGKLLVATMK